MDKPVTLAAVTGAHGVAGEVRLKLFGEGLGAFSAHRQFNDGALTLQKVRDDGKGGAIARFTEVPDRSAAEKLRGTALAVPRSALPPLSAGEYYPADLIGLAVVSDAAEPLGGHRSPRAGRTWPKHPATGEALLITAVGSTRE